MGQVQVPPDSTGKKIATVTIGGLEYQATIQSDPTSALGASVTNIHTGFHQTIPVGGSSLSSGVAQIQTPDGFLDPTLEAGADQLSSRGLPATATYLAQIVKTWSTGSVAASSSPVSIPVASSALFFVGGAVTIDTVASGLQEVQVVNSIPDTTHISVFKLLNPHTSPFPLTTPLYNQERDAAGELDLAPGIGAATAVGYGFDGFSVTRERQIAGIGRFTTTLNMGGGSLIGSNQVLTLTASPPANCVGTPLLIIDGANSEFGKITAVNVVAKTVNIDSLLNAHANGTNVIFAIQQLNAAPVNASLIGIDVEGAAVYSGLSAAGDPLFSIERDANSLSGLTSAAAPTHGTPGTAGVDADLEIGVCLVGAQSYGNNQAVPDQHGQGGEDLVSAGGRVTVKVTGASIVAGNVVVKATPGRLVKVMVNGTVEGANAILIYDNSTTNSGTIIGVIPAAAAVGAIFQFDMPAANGITIAQTAAATDITVSYL